MADYAVGVDFGGTKVLASVVNVTDGKVEGSAKVRTSLFDSGDALMDRIYEVVEGALRDAKKKPKDLAGVGVGIAGQVNAEKGLLIGTANLSRSVVDLPMGKLLEKRFGVPAAIRNDVQIAAIGEHRFGAGKGVDDFICVFVGTGIGGAIVRNGQLIPGAAGNAGELGHTTIVADGRICGCGARGHLEAYASRTAITKTILGELRRGRTSIVTKLIDDLDPTGEHAAIRSGVLKKAIAKKDEVVTEVVRDAARYLGTGLASVVNFVNPQRIVIGGGVMESVPLMFEQAEYWTRREALTYAGEQVEIVRSQLGDFSGVVGAAMIAAGA
ncbi:MAG TPA: ROK family protein [Thermomicrobiales bacterium]|nr:ROK family protein [Thermomicrobiales bacterium]